MAAITRGEEIVARCNGVLNNLRKLSFAPYSSSDISKIIEPIGSAVELFLKTAIFPTSSNRSSFNDLIERLRSTNLHVAHLDNLHELRQFYNRSKHKPGADLDLSDALTVVENARKALEAVNALGLGQSCQPLAKIIKYHLWVGFWDSYTGGFTEIAIMLPGNHWTQVSCVDIMYIKITDWDVLKATLVAHPRFRLGGKNFTPEVWDSFVKENDFLNAGVWDGDYAELVSILACYAYREVEDKLIPGLARKDNYISIGTAIIMSALDIAHAAASPLTNADLAREVLGRADSEYALSSASEQACKAANQVAEIVTQVPFAEWKWLAGPFLALRRERPDGEQASASGPLDVVLDEGSLILRYSDTISISVERPH